jgi:hypothetical protein
MLDISERVIKYPEMTKKMSTPVKPQVKMGRSNGKPPPT